MSTDTAPDLNDAISRQRLLKAFKAMQFGLGIVDAIPRMDVSAAIVLIEQEPALPSVSDPAPEDHIIKVEMGEFTNYHLICNLDDAADCHQVCATHQDGCDPMDVEGECVREVYRNGCTIAEWVNDGGIEAVGFEHIVEIPVTYQWNASHDYPSIHAASVPVLETPPPTENERLNAIFSELECCVEGLFDGDELNLTSRDALLAIIRERFSGAPVEPVPPQGKDVFLGTADEAEVRPGVWEWVPAPRLYKAEAQLRELQALVEPVPTDAISQIRKFATDALAKGYGIPSDVVLEILDREPVPTPRCPHNRVEMLAHQDDIPPDGPCLIWSPICRDCGDDVPMAAPPVGTQP